MPGVTRRVLQRQTMPDGDLILEEITYPPGAAAPVHGHSVGGLVYIIEGTVESAYGDDPPQIYGTGDSLQDYADRPHTRFRNRDPDRPLRFLATYVLPPGRSYVTDA
jgi:quercetin dioxygenase-like cupin family protein